MTEAERQVKQATLYRLRERLTPGECPAVVERHLREQVRRIERELEKDDARLLQDMLFLVGRAAGINRLVRWGPKRRREALDWAAAEHLHASDNATRRKPCPEHVACLPTVPP